MRQTFINTLCELASQDSRIWLLCGDLGFSVLEQFAELFPDRFINIGIAEQNMLGVAAGLALSGKVVFVYSLGNFPTLRCLEQLRNDICYHNLNVNIVVAGSGLDYGSHGYSHHAVEDIAILRSLPHLTIAAPANSYECKLVTQIVTHSTEPSYVRLSKSTYDFTPTQSTLLMGKPLEYCQSTQKSNIKILSTGNMLNTALDIKEILFSQYSLVASVHTFPFIRPICEISIQEILETCSYLVIIEEGSIVGGFSSAILEILNDKYINLKLKILRFGLPIIPFKRANNRLDILNSYNLSASQIVKDFIQATNLV